MLYPLKGTSGKIYPLFFLYGGKNMKVIFEEYGLLILGALAIVVLVACIFFFENPVKDAVQGLISQFSNNVHIPSFGS